MASPKGSESSVVPTLALRSGLSGEFVDFSLLPTLLASLDAADGIPVVSRWADLLDGQGFDSRHIGVDGDRRMADAAAEGAWRLTNRIGWVRSGLLSDAGRIVAALADMDRGARRQALAPMLRKGVEAALVGQNGALIIPLLMYAARSLAVSSNFWVRVCPTLMPVEVGAIVHWACIDIRHAESLVRDIEINRDVPMYRVGPAEP